MRIKLEKTDVVNITDWAPELAEKCRGLRAKLPLYHDSVEQEQLKDVIKDLESEGTEE